jgi:hypothetical protein
MQLVTKESIDQQKLLLDSLSRAPTDEDEQIFRRLISNELSEEQRQRITMPSAVYPKQKAVLALHWHPEFVPMEVISQRIDAMFPNREEDLIVPTQHNRLMSYNGYSGVEVDCYCPSFRRKVQLLFHFRTASLSSGAETFMSMLDHTFQYRAGQLHEFVDSVLEPAFQVRVDESAAKTGATNELIKFVRIYVGRLRQLMERYESITPPERIRNKLIRDYFDALRDEYDSGLINHCQSFLKAVKKTVKRDFTIDYFYEAHHIIEEGRALGAAIVIPHPEQFWPILLEDLDVDGIEVWNPQSYEYTRFLVDVVNRKNKYGAGGDNRLLVTMGDDCHMGEKVKDPRLQDPAKAGREIGLQPPWDDLMIRKSLGAANATRDQVIKEYKSRLH